MSNCHPEDLSRDEIERSQLERLQRLLGEVHARNPFWQQKLGQAGITPGDIRSLDDLRKLPFLTKQELVDDQNANPPYGTNLTYPPSGYSRLHQTSGTTGRPMRWLDTSDSWDWFMKCWAQIYRIVGLREDDVLAFPFSFGPFIGFWAAFDGACRLGRLSLPMGGLTSEARLRMMLELNATFVCCTPTYAMRLVEIAAGKNIDLASSAVRGLVVAGEPGGNVPSVRRRIEEGWGARVFDHWGMTDIGSLGIEPHDAPGGLSILETECIAEIVDPDTGEPVEPGTLGELIITNLGRWGHPVIRYRTGDLVRAAAECPSGRSLLRLDGGIQGRADDMVTIRGNNVFPSSVEAILREFDAVAEYRIIVESQRSMHQLRLEIEPVPAVAEHADEQDRLLKTVAAAIKDRLNFHPAIEAVPVESLPRFELKGRRFVRRDGNAD
ncbi:Phenylacetate-coenzyme A ligase [Maioricimonas rarisocia]|uniref:Phenylacetate-coenzyme A ligase n=1 Tax=Maioricimonas rarisocia TaxID=2528026 RepID=A0A517Z623_9PLAN|nr:AMP-binding protein [Maioricimonas rarisocia]QDU37936.1 Phenylacetate-coenzyme A ligase [Maioricimonas rarisocia]